MTYQLRGKLVDIAETSQTVEILHDGQRVESNQWLHQPQAASTVTKHLAKTHQAHTAWPPSQLI
ncbi:MAG: hypothetical protein K7J46_11215 [Bryobacter sp.]|nr:hypothetical protein [Bryobacter sp. CoA8 C33]